LLQVRNKILVFHNSGIAIGYFAPGGKNIFTSPPTKTEEFKMKIRRNSAEEAKAEHLLFVASDFFEVIK